MANKIFYSIMAHQLSPEQLTAANNYFGEGTEVVEVKFPNVNPEFGKEEVQNLAGEVMKPVLEMEGDIVVHVTGEPSLTHAIVNICKEFYIPCILSTTERVSEEKVLPDGSTQKTNIFKFVRFRHY